MHNSSRPTAPGSNRNVEVSREELFQVICDAASQDPAKIMTSTDRLKQMLDMTGTFDALSEIALQQNLPLQVRQQSIIQLKNAVSAHWRSRRCISSNISPVLKVDIGYCTGLFLKNNARELERGVLS